MPLFEEPKTHPNNNQTQDNSEKEKLNSANLAQKPNNLITTIGQLLPFAPLVFEQFTGQKIPAMSGTMAEIQLNLVNLQTGLQTIVNNQQQLAQRITVLETKFGEQQTKLLEIQSNANHHLTNLNNQFNSLRLTHTREREKKEIAYNNSEDNNY